VAYAENNIVVALNLFVHCFMGSTNLGRRGEIRIELNYDVACKGLNIFEIKAVSLSHIL
jgi:hypothetical protein